MTDPRSFLDAKLKRLPADLLRGGNAKEIFANAAIKFNLPLSVQDHIIDALIFRFQHKEAANAAVKNLEKLSDSKMVADLTLGMKKLQGKFIAMFAAQKIPGASYHFYGHGKEMSEDPGQFIKPLFENIGMQNWMKETVNALGAAHDIVQSKGAPINEKESAAIFVLETNKLIDELILKGGYLPEEKSALLNYRNNAVTFLAEECIVNSTYFLFKSGKRDLDNVLTQIVRQFTNQPDLSREIAGMKMALSLADVRRSEVRDVLSQAQTLKSVPKDQVVLLEFLLRGIGLLGNQEAIQQCKNSEKIEGFLIRLGQNIRMSAEAVVTNAHPDENRELKRARVQIIRDIRADQLDAKVDVMRHLNPFLQGMAAGEAEFARALGIIDKTELLEHANFYGLSKMVNDKTLYLNGWIEHEKLLIEMHDFIIKLSDKKKQEVGQLLYCIAAKVPSHRVGQETYDAMINYYDFLVANENKSPAELSAIHNLEAELMEIEAANRSHLTVKSRVKKIKV